VDSGCADDLFLRVTQDGRDAAGRKTLRQVDRRRILSTWDTFDIGCQISYFVGADRRGEQVFRYKYRAVPSKVLGNSSRTPRPSPPLPPTLLSGTVPAAPLEIDCFPPMYCLLVADTISGPSNHLPQLPVSQDSAYLTQGSRPLPLTPLLQCLFTVSQVPAGVS
jgi:hypothetical protein